MTNMWVAYYSMEMLDKRMSNVHAGMETDNARCHHTTQNDVQFKHHEVFGTFDLNVLSHGWPSIVSSVIRESM